MVWSNLLVPGVPMIEKRLTEIRQLLQARGT
jgi:hypothetical protein